ncbi:MAG: nuclear transport factor 2 family protein [Egibacteraceae bacterium]
MTPIDSVVEGYFAMWNETDATRRREAIAATWSPDGSYLDPMFDAAGHEALDALATTVQERFPGHRFQLTGTIDAHHDRAWWGWQLTGPDGPVATGVDFALRSGDGRLREVTGFFQMAAA